MYSILKDGSAFGAVFFILMKNLRQGITHK